MNRTEVMAVQSSAFKTDCQCVYCNTPYLADKRHVGHFLLELILLHDASHMHLTLLTTNSRLQLL